MNKSKLVRKNTRRHLEVAIDQGVKAAIALDLSEVDLVARLLNRFHTIEQSKVVPLKSQAVDIEYNPSAGP